VADPCPLCRDLQLPDGSPCPLCLSTPATPELRELGWQWFGLAAPATWVPWAPWWRDGPRRTAVVPAYLGAGWGLLGRALARRASVDPHVEWVLQARPSAILLRAGEVWFCSEVGALSHYNGSKGAPRRECLGVVPTLATIPPDAPADLRAARALVLCWEEVSRG